MRAGRLSCWFLVVLAVTMMLAHVCAAPFHAHAGAMTTHDRHGSHDDGDDAGHDAVHAGSCDAVKAQYAGAADVVIFDAVGTIPPEFIPARVLRADTPVVPGSPALFLLHAALLI